MVCDKDTSGLAQLCAAAGGCGLARLDLRDCDLGAAAAAALIGVLPPGGALRELDVSRNRLSGSAVNGLGMVTEPDKAALARGVRNPPQLFRAESPDEGALCSAARARACQMTHDSIRYRILRLCQARSLS